MSNLDHVIDNLYHSFLEKDISIKFFNDEKLIVYYNLQFQEEQSCTDYKVYKMNNDNDYIYIHYSFSKDEFAIIINGLNQLSEPSDDEP